MAPPRTRTVSRVSANASSFAELCEHLNKGEYSKRELVLLTGISMGTLVRWMSYLHKRKLIYIVEYRRNHRAGAWELVWTWGFEVRDAIKPRRKSQAETSRDYRLNKQRKLLGATK